MSRLRALGAKTVRSSNSRASGKNVGLRFLWSIESGKSDRRNMVMKFFSYTFIGILDNKYHSISLVW